MHQTGLTEFDRMREKFSEEAAEKIARWILDYNNDLRREWDIQTAELIAAAIRDLEWK